MNGEIEVYPTKQSLIDRAAELFVTIGNSALSSRGRFAVSLSGGSTPEPLYRLLADRHRGDLDWSRTYFCLGDERFVPPDSPNSNFRMINAALFEPLSIPEENIFRWKTELGDPDLIGVDYEETLHEVFSSAFDSVSDVPSFDLILLGLGPDGHTASIFPDSAAVDEESRNAVANWVGTMNAYRFTLTFNPINAAGNILFLVAGPDKAQVVNKLFKGETAEIPASKVKPIDGRLIWILDEPAAKLLPPAAISRVAAR
ncbi:MAG: 6-phosphogluconolactonase [Acidobacteriota bacterium]